MENRTTDYAHVPQDILDATPDYLNRLEHPDIHGAWQEGAIWERNRNRWKSYIFEKPKKDCMVIIKGEYDLPLCSGKPIYYVSYYEIAKEVLKELKK